jgi:hypothetical protein
MEVLDFSERDVAECSWGCQGDEPTSLTRNRDDTHCTGPRPLAETEQIDPNVWSGRALQENYTDMASDIVRRVCLDVTRYATSGFLRMKLGDALPIAALLARAEIATSHASVLPNRKSRRSSIT